MFFPVGYHLTTLATFLLCFFLENSTKKEKPGERNKERKASRPVRKVQKLPQSSNPDSKPGDLPYCRRKTVACVCFTDELCFRK